ncbi:MAG: hypothetical protein AMDU3_IPLC00003G0031 [Thermoplasmatales archaeon I-plasma]|jgi:hypothetical protein|nr:MAG: hypothetical protein AMDU3_IPLC00003G0031 [Thermoplasmatales archaeon I-plasma]
MTGAKSLAGPFDLLHKAYEYSSSTHPDELEWARKLSGVVPTPDLFLGEYIWVVLASGFSAKAARSVERKLYGGDGKLHPDAVKNRGKRNAVEMASREYIQWFNAFNSKSSDAEKLDYLETLPYIGPVTKYHLGKNLGMDVAKPDRHLQRLADRWGFRDVQQMCRVISLGSGYSIAVVDQVLWRFCADRPAEVWSE